MALQLSAVDPKEAKEALHPASQVVKVVIHLTPMSQTAIYLLLLTTWLKLTSAPQQTSCAMVSSNRRNDR